MGKLLSRIRNFFGLGNKKADQMAEKISNETEKLLNEVENQVEEIGIIKDNEILPISGIKKDDIEKKVSSDVVEQLRQKDVEISKLKAELKKAKSSISNLEKENKVLQSKIERFSKTSANKANFDEEFRSTSAFANVDEIINDYLSIFNIAGDNDGANKAQYILNNLSFENSVKAQELMHSNHSQLIDRLLAYETTIGKGGNKWNSYNNASARANKEKMIDTLNSLIEDFYYDLEANDVFDD